MRKKIKNIVRKMSHKRERLFDVTCLMNSVSKTVQTSVIQHN